ncbi:phosphatidylinositol 3-and 4-kinase domain-containing protein [Cyclospora cayetanensis]|uniref:Phosphatidylinositol 3-and 4-kinase domain-containing protein n=1 Tax=Cyclospora cayetanensis TaxID=88456 RepID=A0A1D3D3B9_9EIME|nr:phosphatidylinositol 3-and 4-kinase domain-containing protein [Cyclospora cayetanensis]
MSIHPMREARRLDVQCSCKRWKGLFFQRLCFAGRSSKNQMTGGKTFLPVVESIYRLAASVDSAAVDSAAVDSAAEHLIASEMSGLLQLQQPALLQQLLSRVAASCDSREERIYTRILVEQALTFPQASVLPLITSAQCSDSPVLVRAATAASTAAAITRPMLLQEATWLQQQLLQVSVHLGERWISALDAASHVAFDQKQPAEACLGDALFLQQHGADLQRAYLGVQAFLALGKLGIRIHRVLPLAVVLPTKERPRLLAMEGEDGICYRFILKAHEDLRQQQRIMLLMQYLSLLLQRRELHRSTFGLEATDAATRKNASEKEQSSSQPPEQSSLPRRSSNRGSSSHACKCCTNIPCALQTRMLVRALDTGTSQGIFLACLTLCLKILRKHRFTVCLLLSACTMDPSLPLKVLKAAESERRHEGSMTSGEGRSPGCASSGDASSSAPWLRTRKDVLMRICNKLDGLDFGPIALDEAAQAVKLIEEATSVRNLSRMYPGWCPYW